MDWNPTTTPPQKSPGAAPATSLGVVLEVRGRIVEDFGGNQEHEVGGSVARTLDREIVAVLTTWRSTPSPPSTGHRTPGPEPRALNAGLWYRTPLSAGASLPDEGVVTSLMRVHQRETGPLLTEP
jgi:hypothetical protein